MPKNKGAICCTPTSGGCIKDWTEGASHSQEKLSLLLNAQLTECPLVSLVRASTQDPTGAVVAIPWGIMVVAVAAHTPEWAWALGMDKVASGHLTTEDIGHRPLLINF